jgi:hypothetical protein
MMGESALVDGDGREITSDDHEAADRGIGSMKQEVRRQSSFGGRLRSEGNRTLLFLGAIFWLMVIIVTAAVLGVVLTKEDDPTPVPTSAPTSVPTATATAAPTASSNCKESVEGWSDKELGLFEKLCPFFDGKFPAPGKQEDALAWLANDDRLIPDDEETLLQRFVVAILYHNNIETLQFMNPTTKTCRWEGVECVGDDITSIDIPPQTSFAISIPSEMGVLTGLTSLISGESRGCKHVLYSDKFENCSQLSISRLFSPQYNHPAFQETFLLSWGS